MLGGVERRPRPPAHGCSSTRQLPRRDLVARPGMERTDGAGVRRAHLVLHLHRLDDDEQRAGVDRMARRDQHLRDPAVHRREQCAGGARRGCGTALEASVDDGDLGAGGEPPAGVAVAAEGGADLAAVDLGARPRRRRRCRGARRGRRSGAARRRSGRRGRRGCRSGASSRLAADDDRHAAWPPPATTTSRARAAPGARAAAGRAAAAASASSR